MTPSAENRHWRHRVARPGETPRTVPALSSVLPSQGMLPEQSWPILWSAPPDSGSKLNVPVMVSECPATACDLDPRKAGRRASREEPQLVGSVPGCCLCGATA